jgi:hypothetical protein
VTFNGLHGVISQKIALFKLAHARVEGWELMIVVLNRRVLLGVLISYVGVLGPGIIIIVRSAAVFITAGSSNSWLRASGWIRV